MPGVAKPVKNFPPGIEGKMIKNDFMWAASNRIRILDEWRKRYDAKSEPKKLGRAFRDKDCPDLTRPVRLTCAEAASDLPGWSDRWRPGSGGGDHGRRKWRDLSSGRQSDQVVRQLRCPLKDISLDVSEGEFVCFLGPSGCGKTTLLRAIAGLDIQTRAPSSRRAGTYPLCRRPNAISASCSSPMRCSRT